MLPQQQCRAVDQLVYYGTTAVLNYIFAMCNLMKIIMLHKPRSHGYIKPVLSHHPVPTAVSTASVAAHMHL